MTIVCKCKHTKNIFHSEKTGRYDESSCVMVFWIHSYDFKK